MRKARPRRWLGTGPWALVLLAWLGLGACAGTERPIFESLAKGAEPETPPVIKPPDANPGPADAGVWEGLPGPVRPPPTEDKDEDGGVLVDPGLDPTADFSWVQTPPGVGTCSPGRYVGAFECTMPGTLTSWPVSVAGEIAFTLQGSAELQMLKIEEGSIEGSFFAAPTMAGQLDCRTDAFGALSTGNAVIFATGSFAATMTGEFDEEAQGIEGTFNMLNDQAEHCDGTFRVRVAP